MMNAQDVLKVHNETFYGALLSGDLDRLSTLYADDYRLVRSDGSVLNREEVLRDLRDGGLAFASIMLCIEDVRIFETAAMVMGESHTVAIRSGSTTSTRFRLVAVYQQMNTALRLSYFQSTNVPNMIGTETTQTLHFDGKSPSRTGDPRFAFSFGQLTHAKCREGKLRRGIGKRSCIGRLFCSAGRSEMCQQGLPIPSCVGYVSQGVQPIRSILPFLIW